MGINKKRSHILFLCISILIFLSGCSTSVGVTELNLNNSITICDTLVNCEIHWFTNSTSAFLEPINFSRTVRVEDLIIANESSLKIGEGVIQSIISSNTLLDGSFNRTILVTNRDTLTESNFDGTLYSAVFNLNSSVDSAASMSAFNSDENAIHIMKVSSTGGSDGLIINENGNLSIVTLNGSKIEFGVFQNLTERTSISPLKTITSINEESVELSIEDNLIKLNTFTNVETNLYFKGLDSASLPVLKTGYIAMYCKDNNKCYIKRDTGVERRLVDAGGGSYIFDEIATFSNETYFTTLSGDGEAYVCVNNIGKIFRSNNPC